MGGAPGMLMYTAPPRRAGVGALFRVHKNGTEPGPRPDHRSEMLIDGLLGPHGGLQTEKMAAKHRGRERLVIRERTKQ